MSRSLIKIQVFENQIVKINEPVNGLALTSDTWQALATYAAQHQEKYFTVLKNGLRFSHYVGTIQVGNVVIEILPKIDQTEDINLQSVLLDMLRECRLLRTEPTTNVSVQWQKGNLLDEYISQFLNEVSALLQEGLQRKYQPFAANRNNLRGRLLLDKQLQHNLVHQERFFTATQEYSFDHPFNRMLHAALTLLSQIPIKSALALRVRQLRSQFPAFETAESPLPDFDEFYFDHRTIRYKNALQTAWFILQQLRPGLRTGSIPVLSVLFDMNLLFEEFIFRQLRKAAGNSILVQRQLTKPFWNRKFLRPDIVLCIENQRVVIDTKWKKLRVANPSAEDLRQLFVYSQYFDAKQSVLVYPRSNALKNMPPTAFFPIPGNEQTFYCSLVFVDLMKEGRLNPELGKTLLSTIAEALAASAENQLSP